MRIAARKSRLACVLSVVAFCTHIAVPAEAPVRSEMVVSTEWLWAHLNDPKVVVLQVGRGHGEYVNGHIPGARFLSSEDFTTGHTGLIVELPPVEQLKDALEEVGVSDDTRVILYTTEWYPIAARAYFTLDYLGHENTALLNGSLAQWKADGHPVVSDLPKVTKGSFTPHVKESVRALLTDARAASQPGSQVVLVDSRPQKRYDAGHLPGADHIFWEETVADPDKPVFLPTDHLRKLFSDRGVSPGHKLITYCEIGLQASHNYFVAKYLGYDVSMFDGSFYQWNDLEHLPVVKGNSPR